MPPNFDDLQLQFERRSAIVAVIGLGYVGLPLVRAFVSAEFRTLGFDIDASKIAKLRAGETYVQHIASAWIREAVASRQFDPTAEMSRLREADAILICVPTPLGPSRDPDLSYVTSTAEQIAAALRPGQLVVLESTTYPGTTRDIVLPILQSRGMRVGQDFYLAYSPEREDPGNAQFTAQAIPKVVGGIDQASQSLACALYRQAIVEVVPVSSCEVAEAAKILENTYRSVNIAMVNELKMLFDRMGINIWEVIDAAKTKPFGFQAFYPGPGLGGHCIPIDPFYLSWIARVHGMKARFVELAGDVNASMPAYVVSRVVESLNEFGKSVHGSRVAILGVAYKKDVDDPRESSAFEIMERLQLLGARISYNDPHIPNLPVMRHYDVPKLASEVLTAEYLAAQDCVVIVTNHSAYDWHFVVEHASLIVDTRNATASVAADCTNVRRA